jgi:enoyl-CoA hydratase/carnithine racemase
LEAWLEAGSLVRSEREGPVATVTIHRSEKRNAITRAMMRELIAAAESLSQDEQTRVVILRGEGGDFSVGIDLKEEREAGSLLVRRRETRLGEKVMSAILEIPQPTICAIQGIATGAGACIASACDFRIGAADTRIGYGEVKIGMNLMWNALPLCVRLVGPARAKRMVMSGALVDAHTLERWGFLDAVVAPPALLETARSWADEYAALPPIAVQMIKRSINHLAGALDRAVMHMDADQFLLASQTQDFREAVQAFLEKRKPQFKGE